MRRIAGIATRLPFVAGDLISFSLGATSLITRITGRAPPDRGLALKQMSGKKMEKFRISLLFACNQRGKKRAIFYIGYSKQPRCFKKKKPAALGFRYRNNKKAWMTAILFDE
jgi:hypothetical protein